jgi:SAM-dependent methyltransferase
MPPQDYWDSFFDVDEILDELLLDSSRRDVLEFGCGYGTFTLPAARRISGKKGMQIFLINHGIGHYFSASVSGNSASFHAT